MKFKKALLLGYASDTLGDTQLNRLKNFCEEIILLPNNDPQINSLLKTVDCLLVKLGATVNKEMIDHAPNLMYVGMLGTGYGRIDTEYATKKNICVTNIAGYSTEGVAELAFGLIIEHLREICRAKLQAKNANYSEDGFHGTEIKNKNFGVIGLGRIGQRIAEIASHGFSANVSYWSRNRKEAFQKSGIRYQDLTELLKNSDIISLNLAYTQETKSFLSQERIKAIKSGAIVLNLAPMELVDIKALEQRLKKGDITFILDHSDELDPGQAKLLSKYKNCIMYPPIGYITKEATSAKLKMFVDNIENFLKSIPTNKVN